jgi:hypothetical protein
VSELLKKVDEQGGGGVSPDAFFKILSCMDITLAENVQRTILLNHG